MVTCALGDLILDVIVRLERLLGAGDDTLATTVLAPGGQAANVAVWAAELGARGRLVTKRADDEPGRLLATELERRDVEVAGPAVEGRTGVVVSLGRLAQELISVNAMNPAIVRCLIVILEFLFKDVANVTW